METTDTEKEAFYPIFNVYSRVGHVCASVQNNVIVWGGYRNDPDIFAEKYLPSTKINVYHTDHRYWTAHETTGYIPPGTSGACAVIIDHKLYVFAGHTRNGNTNCLYYLDLTTLCWTNLTPTLATDDENEEQGVHKGDINVNHKGDFNVDHKGDNNKKEEQLWPSPRDKFTMWSYKHRLYCFGGFGPNFTCDNLGVHGHCPIVAGTISYWCTTPSPTPGQTQHARVRPHYPGLHMQQRDPGLHYVSRQWTQVTVRERRPRLWHTCACTSDGDLLVFGGCENDILNYEEWSLRIT
ncbi:KLDC2-like protein [Mya arenaria]|uniref:KLDC2-like protein n=1 Tax=Mya arenaria TaxID=6604 RepID=A0ABY7FD47_MYAAR|nr:KLDC2-like protein [Mya arenaria]